MRSFLHCFVEHLQFAVSERISAWEHLLRDDPFSWSEGICLCDSPPPFSKEFIRPIEGIARVRLGTVDDESSPV
jgi:hypothetical protein